MMTTVIGIYQICGAGLAALKSAPTHLFLARFLGHMRVAAQANNLQQTEKRDTNPHPCDPAFISFKPQESVGDRWASGHATRLI